MATSSVAREVTLPPRMLPSSGSVPAGIHRFLRCDELSRQRDMDPVDSNVDRQFHSSSSAVAHRIFFAAPLTRPIAPGPILASGREGDWFRVSSQGLAENPVANPLPAEFGEYIAALLEIHREIELPAIVREFAAGLDGVRPDRSVVAQAERLVKAALQRTAEPEIAVDVDGALSFDLRLSNGLLLLAELSVAGNLDASVYDDAAGERAQRLPQATEAQFMELLR